MLSPKARGKAHGQQGGTVNMDYNSRERPTEKRGYYMGRRGNAPIYLWVLKPLPNKLKGGHCSGGTMVL